MFDANRGYTHSLYTVPSAIRTVASSDTGQSSVSTLTAAPSAPQHLQNVVDFDQIMTEVEDTILRTTEATIPTGDRPTISASRNANRLQLQHDENTKLIGTYPVIIPAEFTNKSIKRSGPLSDVVDDYLPRPIIMTQEAPFHNKELFAAVRTAVTAPSPTPGTSPFKFVVSAEAAEFNSKLLSRYDYDIDKCINAAFTTSTPGSEFRPVPLLRNIFHRHPLWSHAYAMLTSGANMHLKHEPTDDQRVIENKALIELNNHKKARDNPEVIEQSLAKEVSLGFCAVIPISTIHQLPKAMVCPLGIVEQLTLTASGERKTKRRLTHDQSFCLIDGSESVNALTAKELYHELLYGFCMYRLIYQTLSLRQYAPHQRILCSKYDFGKAFRRLHFNGWSAARCIAVFGELAYLMFRLSFGGAGCPPSWCTISELITELANELSQDDQWDATPPLLSPDQHLIPEPVRLSDEIPFAPALPTMLLPPPRPEGHSDVFVDDVITLFLDNERKRGRIVFFHAI